MDKFEALYVVNKNTKKYKSLGGERNIDRLEALYNLKHTLVNEWVDEFNTIEKHIIDDTEYYYFKSAEHGFHVPKDEIDIENQDIEKQKLLSNFQNTVVNKSSITEREALMFILNNYGYNPNYFLPKDHKMNAKWGYIY